MLAVFVGFALGKPVGILTFSWLTVRSKIAIIPADINWKLLASGGLLAGIGFMMALFIAQPGLRRESDRQCQTRYLTGIDLFRSSGPHTVFVVIRRR